jgi:hypothetical protein
MKILRTDGGGDSLHDERLVRFRNALRLLNPDTYNKIMYVHDHKGMFQVYFYLKPSQSDIDCLHSFIWHQFGENLQKFYFVRWDEVELLAEFA